MDLILLCFWPNDLVWNLMMCILPKHTSRVFCSVVLFPHCQLLKLVKNQNQFSTRLCLDVT